MTSQINHINLATKLPPKSGPIKRKCLTDLSFGPKGSCNNKVVYITRHGDTCMQAKKYWLIWFLHSLNLFCILWLEPFRRIFMLELWRVTLKWKLRQAKTLAYRAKRLLNFFTGFCYLLYWRKAWSLRKNRINFENQKRTNYHNEL